MVLLYRPFNRSNAIEGARWAQRQAANNPQNVGGIGVNIKATLLEQKLLLKLLKMNAKLLPSDFTVEKQPDEERFKLLEKMGECVLLMRVIVVVSQPISSPAAPFPTSTRHLS